MSPEEYEKIVGEIHKAKTRPPVDHYDRCQCNECRVKRGQRILSELEHWELEQIVVEEQGNECFDEEKAFLEEMLPLLNQAVDKANELGINFRYVAHAATHICLTDDRERIMVTPIVHRFDTQPRACPVYAMGRTIDAVYYDDPRITEDRKKFVMERLEEMYNASIASCIDKFKTKKRSK